MAGINSGLLTNATPLTTSQEAELEARAIADGQAYAYLNADKQICFILHESPEVIRKIAWHNTYELSADNNNTLTKKVYKKHGLSEFYLTDVLLKPSSEDAWLPQEYQRVDYLENSGTQFINLGIKPDNNTSIDIKYESIQAKGQSQYIIGARLEKYSTINYALNGSASTNFWSARFTNTDVLETAMTRNSNIINSKITLNNGAGEWRVTDLSSGVVETKILQDIEVSSTADLHIFAFNKDNIHVGLRIYSCKIYRGDEIVADLIPCYRKIDGIAGMFDAVTKHFYVNDGSGEFICLYADTDVASVLDEGLLNEFILE